MLEDSPTDAELIRRVLKKEFDDCRFELTLTRDRFLKALEEFNPQLILADNSLPQFDAMDALLIVRERGIQLPFIMVSGTTSEEYAVKIIKAGADDYILKDRLTRLPAAIETAIRYREAENEKRKVAAELEKSEEKYRTIVDRISDGFMIVDKEWGVVYANQMADQMFGKPRGFLTGKELNKEFPQAVGRPFFNAYLEAMEKAEKQYVEEYSVVADRWLQASLYPSENGVAVLFRDVSEQRKAEEEVKKSEERFRIMLERISDGFIVLDREWRALYVNRAAEKMFQRPPGYLMGKRMQDKFPGSEKRPFLLAYGEAVKTGEKQYLEEYAPTIDCWLQASIYPSPDGVAVFFRDTTEQRKAEEEVRKSEEKYRVFIHRITDAFISLDRNWCYTYLNKQAGDMFKRKPEELIGKNVWAVFPDAIYSSTFKAYSQAMTEQRYISNVDYYAPLDLWQENHIYPSADGITVFIRNITEKKKLELELIDRQKKEQQQMIAAAIEAQEKERNAIAIELHDNVNQILVGTKVMLSVVRDHPEKAVSMLQTCMDNLAMAINENRKIAHELVTPNLKIETLVQQLSGLCENMLRPAGIEPYLQHEQFEENQLTDNQKLAVYRVAQEQCTNIIKYARAASVIMTLSTPDESFVFRITDDGVGADPAKSKKGIGLQNISNRIAVFGGTVQINTKKGEGFELEINMPAG